MTEREARIAFNMVPEIGSVKLEKLMREAGGSAAEAYQLFPFTQTALGKEPAWQRELERAANSHVTIITAVDDTYPELLKKIASPPLALYVAGNVEALSKPCVALVGTRRATSYGRETTEKFAFSLASAGWGIVSGLALGVDAAAHRGALAALGITVGILGGALDKFYPNANRNLAHEMVAKGGAVVSEFPFGRAPDQQTFPQRNRIVAGLSRGVVAIEAPTGSGTLITCRLALEEGRPVMAVPGRIDSPYSTGCLKLIREGATLVRSADDIIEEVSPFVVPPKPSEIKPTQGDLFAPSNPKPISRTPPHTPIIPPEEHFTLEESAIMRAIPQGGAIIDQIAESAHIPIARTNSILVALRMKRKIRFLPGNRAERV